jgi:SSS family solute:Na+ symporter
VECCVGLSSIDTVIVVVYLAGITLAGIMIGRTQRTSQDYFLGGRKLAWWAVGFSIVATETSTITFISVPGLGYNSTMQFMQVVFGYFIGRLIVSAVFIPAYYRGALETAYDFLGKRFGPALRKFSSSVFLITRVLASGVRLFSAAIPVHFITNYDYITSILIIGILTLIYTYFGGLKAVVTMDVVQMCIYLVGAMAAMIIILNRLPEGWNDVVRMATADGVNKFQIFNISSGQSLKDFFSNPYTLAGGVIGGIFLSMGSHGTDQLLVQRLLSCKTCKDSQRALLLDATLIVVQFAFFLVLGLCLFAFYKGIPVVQLGLKSSDEIFPKFIKENLPIGLTGLVVAGVLASAMGSLSSAISSLASSAFLDLVRKPIREKLQALNQEIFWSRIMTFIWGILLIGVAMLFISTSQTVIEMGLQIMSLTYGGLLGIFFLGLLSRKSSQIDATIGFIAGLLTMIWIVEWTTIGFTWHICIGCIVTIITGTISRFVRITFFYR